MHCGVITELAALLIVRLEEQIVLENAAVHEKTVDEIAYGIKVLLKRFEQSMFSETSILITWPDPTDDQFTKRVLLWGSGPKPKKKIIEKVSVRLDKVPQLKWCWTSPWSVNFIFYVKGLNPFPSSSKMIATVQRESCCYQHRGMSSRDVKRLWEISDPRYLAFPHHSNAQNPASLPAKRMHLLGREHCFKES